MTRINIKPLDSAILHRAQHVEYDVWFARFNADRHRGEVVKAVQHFPVLGMAERFIRQNASAQGIFGYFVRAYVFGENGVAKGYYLGGGDIVNGQVAT